jgi:hypothetical protein
VAWKADREDRKKRREAKVGGKSGSYGNEKFSRNVEFMAAVRTCDISALTMTKAPHARERADEKSWLMYAANMMYN